MMSLNEIEDKIEIFKIEKEKIERKLKSIQTRLFIVNQDLNVLYDLKKQRGK